MANIFVNPEYIQADTVLLTGTDHHHVTRVLRLKAGDALTVLDNAGHLYSSEITHISKSQTQCRVLEVITKTRSGPEIILAQGLIKGEKMDWVVQKATELGVSVIVPLLTERAVVKLRSNDITKKVNRWQAIAKSAAQQCERFDLPVIQPPIALDQLTVPEDSLGFVGVARGVVPSLASYIPRGVGEDANPCLHSSLLFAIGPEGGFTPDEEKILQERGCRPISLAPYILRAETAAVAALSQVQLFYSCNRQIRSIGL